MAVLNDHIRLPNKIQNRRNKETYSKYALTNDIVPLVLENSYFTGPIIEYKGIIIKIHLWTKHKVDSVQGIR